MQTTENNNNSLSELKEKVERDKPTRNQIEAELMREKYRHSFSRNLRNAIFILIVVAAAAILVATLWLPVLQIYGNSMEPTLRKNAIVVSVKTADFETGDIVSFYYNNKILVKRVIASEGDWVDIDEYGNVYVNDILIAEPYLTEGAKALGDCNITLPYQVPDGKIFVMGDNRATSVDSRNKALGCIGSEQVVGKLVFTIWPVESFGKLDN